MIDNLQEYEEVKSLVEKYEDALGPFLKDSKEKDRVKMIREEVADLKAQLREYDKRQSKN